MRKRQIRFRLYSQDKNNKKVESHNNRDKVRKVQEIMLPKLKKLFLTIRIEEKEKKEARYKK